MRFTDWVMVTAILLGPLLAVQAQKLLERFRERRQRRLALFCALMATRTARVSTCHVEALNGIDLQFYGESLFGRPRLSRAYKSVREAWSSYRDHLNTTYTPQDSSKWLDKGDDLFVNLLHEMSKTLGFDFDKVTLKRAVYTPVAFADEERVTRLTRQAVLDVLEGKRSEPITIPPPPTAQS